MMYGDDYLRYEDKYIWYLNPTNAALFRANKGMYSFFISFLEITITPDILWGRKLTYLNT